GGDRSTISAICAQTPSCVIDAINHQLDVLEDFSKSDQERAAAVRYILHFGGDIHQPLHCTTNGNKGANCDAVQRLVNISAKMKDIADGCRAFLVAISFILAEIFTSLCTAPQMETKAQRLVNISAKM